MTEKEWEKVHLGSIVEYSTFNLASFIFGGLIYGGYHDFHRTEVLGIRVDKKIYCKLDGKKKPRWYNIDGFKLIEEEQIMAWVAVDKIGEELISRTEPFRVGDYWIGYSIFHLPKGSIKKLIGRDLSFFDKPVEIK